MKRTKHIDLAYMRKGIAVNPLKPLALAVLATLYGCSSPKEEVILVKSTQECRDKTNLSTAECEAAYKKAVAEAERTGPKFSTKEDCEEEFGYDECYYTDSNVYMPMITGYLVSAALDSNSNGYYGSPVYIYSGSRYRGKVMMPDGSLVGNRGANNYTVSRDSVTQSKPTVTKTSSRGGFGSTASAKSSWGGGSSSGSWGG